MNGSSESRRESSRNTADAEDVVQDGFLRALRSVQRGQLQLDQVNDGMLIKIVTRLSLNWLRTQRRAADRERAAALPDVIEANDAHVALRELGALLEALPPDQRAALVLQELEGIPARQVAQVLGCSEAAVGQRVLRARRALRKKVSP